MNVLVTGFEITQFPHTHAHTHIHMHTHTQNQTHISLQMDCWPNLSSELASLDSPTVLIRPYENYKANNDFVTMVFGELGKPQRTSSLVLLVGVI